MILNNGQTPAKHPWKKPQLERVENSKLFYKRKASI